MAWHPVIQRQALIAFLTVLAIGAAACGGGDSNAPPAAPSTPITPIAPGALTGSTQVPALADMLAEKRIGSADAPNVVMQYSSLGCSHCAAFHAQTLQALKSQFLDRGLASYVYRDFPLDRTSLLGGMVARCAGDSRYFAVLDVLYQSQAAWAGASDSWSAMQKVLRDAGLAQSLIDACVATVGLEQGVTAIRQQGADTYGVNATPTFIVNGTKVVGNVPLATLTSYFK